MFLATYILICVYIVGSHLLCTHALVHVYTHYTFPCLDDAEAVPMVRYTVEALALEFITGTDPALPLTV